jgi:DNA-directed RNA polymerase subunit L
MSSKTNNHTGIKIVELFKEPAKGLASSQLVLELSGSKINTSVVNTLKRVTEDDVPTYAFYKDNILIEKNTSIFDNDYMKMRLEQLTVPNIKIPVSFLHDNYWKYVDYGDPERKKHEDDSRLIEFSINATNETTEIMNVTTNGSEFKYYEDGVEDKKKFDTKYSFLIIKLKPGQTFKCSAKASLGCGRRKDIWAAAANTFFETDDEKKFKFTLISQGQIDEYKILHTGCEIIKSKLKEIKERIDSKSELVTLSEKGTKLHVKLDEETHTIGNIINDSLQRNSDIVYSGLSKPDTFKDEILIKLESVKPNPIKYFFNTLEDLIELFDDLQSNFK